MRGAAIFDFPVSLLKAEDNTMATITLFGLESTPDGGSHCIATVQDVSIELHQSQVIYRHQSTSDAGDFSVPTPVLSRTSPSRSELWNFRAATYQFRSLHRQENGFFKEIEGVSTRI